MTLVLAEHPKERGASSPSASPAPLSPVTMQLLLGQICLDKGKPSEAFSLFEVASRSGDPRALNMLGRAYERGWGVARNPAAACAYFTQAAADGDGWAMFNLADLYLAGEGVPQDIRKAYSLYISSAQNGVSKAFNMLGLIAENGSLPELEPAKAQDFFLAAAQSGDCWGYLNLARNDLSSGRTEAAIKWFSRALEEGFRDVFKALETLLQDHPDPRLRAIAEQAGQRWRTATAR
ncbi:tetratricopeptide repeat protein [Acetobacter cerevisiae]|uniref:tetratricopeptide repeat protein n=1 Tax=Acetobacter cerevisiae TaxID=178900 RepID=UPI00209E3448|nr:tetratricopeptide repeat protein [Acetobacter cerevisiae]MCP1270864.1 sel1 repeat family protein [Acetobacter cerevisiae]MCP1278803.1 sel1 repeat family protein [Acetobacter cerevisiae]